MHPWEHPAPAILYKYLKPDRLDVLTGCRIRFSPRTAFEDDHELQPDYDEYGTVDEIQKQIEHNGVDSARAREIAAKIASDPTQQKIALETAVRNIASLDKIGILCLSVSADSVRMWTEYACRETGFVIGFDTAHPGFKHLAPPKFGVWGKVIYNSDGIPTFLGMMEKYPFEPLFRKRMQYSFEQEWRSLRLFKNLDEISKGISCSSFDPACVREIVIGSNCTLEAELRELAVSDWYKHVRIEKRG